MLWGEAGWGVWRGVGGWGGGGWVIQGGGAASVLISACALVTVDAGEEVGG